MFDDIVKYNIDKKVKVVCLNTKELTKLQRISKMRRYFSEEQRKDKKLVLIPFHDSCLNYTIAATIGMNVKVFACERNNPYQKGENLRARLRANIPYLLSSFCVFQTEGAKKYYYSMVRRKSAVIFNPIVINPAIVCDKKREKRIVSVGRLEPQKNQKMLVDAFAMVHKEFPEYILEIYGEGSLRNDLERYIKKLDLEEFVFLRGQTNKVLEKISSASVFALSSDYEGMSNALIEAMALGLPVVSTDHPPGGAKELINNGVNGFLTPVGEAEELATAIKRMLTDEKMAEEMGKNAASIREKLSISRISNEWLKTIKKQVGWNE